MAGGEGEGVEGGHDAVPLFSAVLLGVSPLIGQLIKAECENKRSTISPAMQFLHGFFSC